MNIKLAGGDKPLPTQRKDKAMIEILSFFFLLCCIIGFCYLVAVNSEHQVEKMKKKRTPEEIKKDQENDQIIVSAAICAILDSFDDTKKGGKS